MEFELEELTEVKMRRTIDRGHLNQKIFGCFFYGSASVTEERERKHRVMSGDNYIPARVIDCLRVPLDMVPLLCETEYNIYDCEFKDWIVAIQHNDYSAIITHRLHIGKITGLDTPIKAQEFLKNIMQTHLIDSCDITLIIYERTDI